MKEENYSLIFIKKIQMPIYSLVDIDAEDFLKDIKNILKRAKEENKHFNWKVYKWSILQKDDGEYWLCGYKK
jgi:hypothetical protein